MSFGKYGAKPRSMNNPVYWVNRHLQDKRQKVASAVATEKFNEKWHRLEKIRNNLHEHFITPLNGINVSAAEANAFHGLLVESNDRRKFIQESINSCSVTELSKYATSIKKLALLAFKLCKKYQIYSDIDNVIYKASDKAIFLNGEIIYFLG